MMEDVEDMEDMDFDSSKGNLYDFINQERVREFIIIKKLES